VMITRRRITCICSVKMRLFIALDLSPEVKDYLFDLERKMNAPVAKVKWVSKKHLHLTLKFLSEVPESRIPEIVERLSKIKKRSIKVRLSGVGFFPNERNIKVIWVGIQPEDEVCRIQQEVDGELLGMFSDDQRFDPHLTLGRVKSVRRNDDFLKMLKGIQVKPLEFEFSGLKLYQSILKGATQEYVCLKEF